MLKSFGGSVFILLSSCASVIVQYVNFFNKNPRSEFEPALWTPFPTMITIMPRASPDVCAYIYIYIHVYIYVCVCVCVCVWFSEINGQAQVPR